MTKLRTPERPLPVIANSPPGFHLLSKPSGSTCNINCTYCFFLSKEALYPNEKSRMSSETLEEYIRQLLESHRTPEVTIAWQGGHDAWCALFKEHNFLVGLSVDEPREFHQAYRRADGHS